MEIFIAFWLGGAVAAYACIHDSPHSILGSLVWFLWVWA